MTAHAVQKTKVQVCKPFCGMCGEQFPLRAKYETS